MTRPACTQQQTPLLGYAPPATRRWTAEAYVAALHPPKSRGVVSFLCRRRDGVAALSLCRDAVDAALWTLTEQESYVGMNRYHGPRGGTRRLAALNAVWLDLDTYRALPLVGVPRATIAAMLQARLEALGLPSPSFRLDSGRGFYLVWLIDGAAPAALPRWRAVMGALVSLFPDFGADPACVDPARVLRLPESWHEGVSRQVAVLGGDGVRHPFDTLADAIWRASGRPDRATLQARRSRPAGPGRVTGGGLSRHARQQAIRRDLDRLLAGWGGRVPEGCRDLWLHAMASCLAWVEPDADLVARMIEIAATATPAFAPRTVSRLVGTTCRRAARAAQRGARHAATDPRYSYSGGRLAAMLGVTDADATRLGLEQIIPDTVRRERRMAHRRRARREAGALPRSLWLAANPTSREEPWRAAAISRATWYRRRRAQATQDAAIPTPSLAPPALTPAETGRGETAVVTLYKGEAQPGAARPRAIASRGLQPITSTPPARSDRRQGGRTGGGSMLPHPPEVPITAAISLNPHPATGPTGRHRKERRMPTTQDKSLDVLAALPGRGDITAAQVARLGAVALALAAGPCPVADLPARARCSAAEITALASWLDCDAAGQAIGLRLPRTARKPGSLLDLLDLPPDPACVPAPPPLASPGHGLRQTARGRAAAAVIDLGVAILTASGKSEEVARRMVGSLRREVSDGALLDALLAVSHPDRAVAEPMGYIRGCLGNAGAAQRKPTSRSARTASPLPVPTPPSPRPLATPEYLGISPERAAKIAARNAQLK